MRRTVRKVVVGITILCGSALAQSSGVDVKIIGSGKVDRINAKYDCGTQGVAMGLPAGIFTVRYLRAGENGLAILPVHGKDLIFAQLLSANGGRYGASRYEWWTARETTFTDGQTGADHTATCKSID